MRRGGFSYAGALTGETAAAAAFLGGLADALPDEPEAPAEALGAEDGLAERKHEWYNQTDPHRAPESHADDVAAAPADEGAAPNETEDEAWFFTRRYAYPKLNSREWDLLNYTMDSEIGSSEQYLNEETKWLFADKKGTQVFAVYGIGDGTEPTALYASGGKKAVRDHEKLRKRMEGRNGAHTDRTTLDRLLGDVESRRT